VCTVSGKIATLVAVGLCTIQASQPGNYSFAPATPVTPPRARMPGWIPLVPSAKCFIWAGGTIWA
jgi:hypothetical protein